jgi:hypothetical protein
MEYMCTGTKFLILARNVLSLVAPLDFPEDTCILLHGLTESSGSRLYIPSFPLSSVGKLRYAPPNLTCACGVV